MHLQHYNTFKDLTTGQLVAQWRVLNIIFRKQPDDANINFVYEYPKSDLAVYGFLLIEELHKRGVWCKYSNWNRYFGGQLNIEHYNEFISINPFVHHMK